MDGAGGPGARRELRAAPRADRGAQPPPRRARACGGRGPTPRLRSTRPRSSSWRCCTTSASSRSIRTSSTGPARSTSASASGCAGTRSRARSCWRASPASSIWPPPCAPRTRRGTAPATRTACSGEQIPLTARIVTVVDAFDAMTSERAYRQPLPRREALRRLRAGAGRQFDPRVVDSISTSSDASGAVAPTSMRVCPSCPRSRSPRAGWTRRCAARRSSRRWRPGINALKTFDPPLHALDGPADRRRAPHRQAPRRRRRRRPRRCSCT